MRGYRSISSRDAIPFSRSNLNFDLSRLHLVSSLFLSLFFGKFPFKATTSVSLSMPKRKKNKKLKVKDVSQLSSMANLTGFGENEGSALDDCMAEMMFQGQSQKQSPQSDAVSRDNTTELDRARGQNKDDRTMRRIGRIKTRQPSWIEQLNRSQTSSKSMNTEDIEIWNRKFKTWAKGGLYAPGLLPNIDQEISRNFKVKELSTLLLKNEDVKGKDLRMPLFERWLLDSKHEEEIRGLDGDSVLPLKSSPDSDASQRLLSELTSKQNGVEQDAAEMIIAKLCRTTNLTCQELLSQDDRYRRQSPLKNGDRINIEANTPSNNGVVSIEYSRKKWKKPFCFKLNLFHYKNLKDRFVGIHLDLSFGDNKTVKTKMEAMVERSFHVLVLALLLRYSALSGGGLLDDLRGGGMQGAIHSSVFEVLESHFSSERNSDSSDAKSSRQFWFEGFASPFNATLPRFASAFPDLDWHFGSVGHFLDCKFNRTPEDNDTGDGEYCEANPPFTPGIMLSMADHMIETLEKADKNNSRLTFVVVVPSIDNKTKRSKSSTTSHRNDNTAVAKHAAAKSFCRMTSSVYCTKHIIFNAREHGYVEGAQHLRPTKYKQSSYDTSVIILQSPNACETSKSGLEKLEKNLRLAFSSRHEMELVERKRKISSIN